ncbi:hypothetical protein [Sphingomonas sp.]|uniref:hypothetical protein n=1 Tax=Sphingomonas sp. TaxID=28214 RepID=UPI002ED9B57C
MTDHPIRFFADDAAIVRLGEGLIACTLAREEWTHEAHLAACLYLLVRRPDVDVDGEIARLISRFNESVGGVNDDHNGYHDTITRTYVAGVRRFLAKAINPPPEGEVPSRSDDGGVVSASGVAWGEYPSTAFGGPTPPPGEELAGLANALLASEVGSRDWPLRFYSRELLFSVRARRGFVEPDRAPLP